jgi:hypothetical protein
MNWIELNHYPITRSGGTLMTSTPFLVNQEEIVCVRTDGEGGCFLVTTTGVEYRLVDKYHDVLTKLGIWIDEPEQQEEERVHE